jgi:peptidoglycan/xylan/chitin deacetylase (PgdA/CDA1 family)
MTLFATIPLFIIAFFCFWFARRGHGSLRVLMYHKIDLTQQDMLAVSVRQFEEQLKYLQNTNYQYITIKELENNKTIPKKATLLTFDDGYVNNLELAYSILKKYGAKATIFIPTAYVGRTSSWDNDAAPILSLAQLQALDSSVFELALHSHQHQNYEQLTIEEIEADIKQNIQFFSDNNLPFVHALAYPYGGRPKNKVLRTKMHSVFAQFGIKFAFRIGNRLNGWPLTDLYEIQRLDIRGTDSMSAFKRKLRWGKLL